MRIVWKKQKLWQWIVSGIEFVGRIAGGKIYDNIKFSRIAHQGVLIGKTGKYIDEASSRNLAYYDGMPGFKTIEKIFLPLQTN